MKFEIIYELKNEIQIAEKVLNDLSWYKENGYLPFVPENTDGMIVCDAIKNDFQKSKKDFGKKSDEVSELLKFYSKDLNTFFSFFDYDIPKSVKVFFTNYGSGGSYYPPNEIIVLAKDSPKNIFQTIVHEVLHLFLEIPFIEMHSIPHKEKEMIVDYLCASKLLHGALHDYEMQYPINKSALKFLSLIKFKNGADICTFSSY